MNPHVTIKISPSFDHSKLAGGRLEDKIDVFVDRIGRGLLDQAAALFQHGGDGGTAALLILLPYFETITQYRKGEDSERQSKAFFSEELARCFPLISESAAKEIYKEVRCGLMHGWAQRGPVVLSNRYRSEAIHLTMNGTAVAAIEIYPEKLLDDIQNQFFPAFLAEVRDLNNMQLRKNFEKLFDKV